MCASCLFIVCLLSCKLIFVPTFLITHMGTIFSKLIIIWDLQAVCLIKTVQVSNVYKRLKQCSPFYNTSHYSKDFDM